MRFTFISTFLYADAETPSRTAENEFCLLRKRTRSFFEAFSLAFFVCSLLFSTNNGTFAQNAATKVNSANSVLSPEEATGVSLRDFDALRAMSSDYLKNPDGKEVPVDEDDLWLPELSLGQKEQTEDSGVRVISFTEKETTTEVRNYNSASQNSSHAVSSTRKSESKQPSASTSQTAKEQRTQSPRLASYTASPVAQNSIRQTQAESPRQQTVGGFDGYAQGGFSGYEPISETALESPSPESNVVKTAMNTTGHDAYLPGRLDGQNAANPNNALQGVGAPIEANSVQLNQTSTPQLQLESAPNIHDSENIADSTVSPIIPEVLSAEQDVPATQNPVSNDTYSSESEPFRESFGRGVREEVETEAEESDSTQKQLEKNPNEISLEEAKLSENEVKNLTVEDIRISRLEMSTQQFNNIVKTRIGAKFNQQRLEEDKRALLQTNQFIDVAVSTSWSPDNPDKVIVNFDLTPRRLMRYVKVVGNRAISKHDILEELGIKAGESRMDPYEVENGRLRIIELYKSKDYAEPHVEILRGDRPEDVGVVYLIDEGLKQRVLRTSFVGNTAVSGARLRSLISVKPGFLLIFGGKFTRDRLDADVEKLLEYYRQLGFFDARIDREYQEGSGFAGLGKDNVWVTVRYIIDEGPRYKIRNYVFNGNRVLKKEDLEKELKVKRGSYYYYNDVEMDRIALRCKYQDLGYVRADVTPNPLFTDEVGVVDIRYDIVEDHRYRVRDVIVDYVGSESRTMTPVVLNMLDLTPGELLNGVKIRQSENTLRQSGYFNDKPNEGQLPEIAVIPDEKSVFNIENEGGANVIREARKPKEKAEKEESSTERGQVAPPERVTRGQAFDSSSKRTRPAYVSYEDSKASNSAVPERMGYRSYAPSIQANALAASNANLTRQPTPPTYISPIRPFSSIIRGQTTIPSGFSPTTTSANASPRSTYQGFGNGVSSDSQYSNSRDYANSGTEYGSEYEGNTAAGFSAGVFESVGQEAMEPITPESDEIYNGDVLIKLQEGRTGMFTASIGVNSDYGLVGNVSFTERNFNLFRPPSRLFSCDGWHNAFRGGGQILNIQASPGANVQSYRVSWDVPYIFHTKNTFGVTGLYGDRSYDEWFETRYGGEVRLGRQWTPRFSTTLSAGIYNVKISDPQVLFVPDLTEALGTNREYTIGLTAAYDTRNHPYTPSEGFLLKGSLEEVLGDYQFPRATFSGRYYKTLHKRVDGSGRWVLGLSSNASWNGSDAPIYERYYGGGSTTIRGFEYRGISPRYQKTGFGVGGNFEIYNTAELLVPVSGGDEFQLAMFVDSGTVSKSIKKWGRYRVAPGVGLRFSIPMLGPAPLAIDFAFPVNKSPDDDEEIFSFTMMGSR